MTDYKPERIQEFRKVYGEKLADSIRKHPQSYADHDAAKVADKMTAAIAQKGIRAVMYNSPAFKGTAKHFGIGNTAHAWGEWFRG